MQRPEGGMEIANWDGVERPCQPAYSWSRSDKGQGRAKRNNKSKEAAEEEEEADLLAVSFYHIHEFLSPVITRAPGVNTVQADPIVPVNFVPVNPITFVHASSPSVPASSSVFL